MVPNLMEKQRRIKYGIGKKLLIWFLALSLVPIMVFGSVCFTVTKKRLKNNVKTHLSDLARDCGRKISYYVSSRYQDIKLFSQADVFKGNDTDAKQKYIEEIIDDCPFCSAVYVIDLKGRIIACTRKELIGKSRADRKWFQRTIQCKKGDVIPVDAYRAETAGWKVVIGFNTPITDHENRQAKGILSIRVKMDHIIERVLTLDERTGNTNRTYLLNRRGEILAGPDKKEFLTTHRLYKFPVVRDLIAGKTGISEYKNDRGEDVISAGYAIVGEGPFNGWGWRWGIIMTQPVSGAFKSAYEIRNALIILLITVAFFITLGAIFISKVYSRPVTELSKAAFKISQGDLKPIKIKYGPYDEIAGLVDAFNKMIKNLHATTVSRDLLSKEVAQRMRVEEKLKETGQELKRHRDNLEELVTERTDELAKANGRLKSEMKRRKLADEKIKASLKEKEVLLNEIHHRVKNNLQVISSLLDMSSLRTNDQQVIDLFKDARTKIQTMALIHSQLYRSDRFSKIEMGSYLQELIIYLMEIYAKRKIIIPVVETHNICIPLNQAIPCAIVLNELISNAFKHAFKESEKGTMKISMQLSAGDRIRISVKNDGIGIRDESDIYITDSLGLKLVRNLVQKQLKGKIQVRRDKGTEFIMEFKILEKEERYA